MSGAVSIAAGYRFCLVVKSDGSLWGWGSNNEAQLGIGHHNNVRTGEAVKIMDDVHSVSTGTNINMALKTDGSVWAWGLNLGRVDYFLGNGTTSGSDIPVRVMSDARAISAGTVSMVIDNDGSLWTWGTRMVGNGTAGAVISPVKIMDGVMMPDSGTTTPPPTPTPPPPTPDDPLEGAADWALTELEAALEAGLLVDAMLGNWEAHTTRLLAAEVLANLVEISLGMSIGDVAESNGWDLSEFTFNDTDSEAAAFLRASGISPSGVGEGNFGANDVLSRAQWILMLARTATNVLGIDISVYPLGSEDFDDIFLDWPGLDQAVGWAYATGITQGRGERMFGSAVPLENQMTGVFLYRALN
jgi:hypothetical protein